MLPSNPTDMVAPSAQLVRATWQEISLSSVLNLSHQSVPPSAFIFWTAIDPLIRCNPLLTGWPGICTISNLVGKYRKSPLRRSHGEPPLGHLRDVYTWRLRFICLLCVLLAGLGWMQMLVLCECTHIPRMRLYIHVCAYTYIHMCVCCLHIPQINKFATKIKLYPIAAYPFTSSLRLKLQHQNGYVSPNCPTSCPLLIIETSRYFLNCHYAEQNTRLQPELTHSPSTGTTQARMRNHHPMSQNQVEMERFFAFSRPFAAEELKVTSTWHPSISRTALSSAIQSRAACSYMCHLGLELTSIVRSTPLNTCPHTRLLPPCCYAVHMPIKWICVYAPCRWILF